MNKESFKHSFHLYTSLVSRHLKVLLTNAIRLFYTLLVPVVLLVVYFIFLRGLEVSTVENELLRIGVNTSDNQVIPLINTVIDSWMLSGVICLSSITISLQICSLLVEDKVNKVVRDFVSSPIDPNILYLSYFSFLFIVTFLLSIVVLLVCFICLGILGEFMFSFSKILILFLIIVLTNIFSSLTALFVSSLVKSEPVLASIAALVSTAAGFLIGAYMPLGLLPKGVQYFCAFIPWTYSCALLRYCFLSIPFEMVSNTLSDSTKITLPSGIAPEKINQLLTENFSYKINFFGIYLEPWHSAIITVGFIIIFIVLCKLTTKNLINLDKPNKKGKVK